MTGIIMGEVEILRARREEFPLAAPTQVVISNGAQRNEKSF
jgi:hypothetical protein